MTSQSQNQNNHPPKRRPNNGNKPTIVIPDSRSGQKPYIYNPNLIPRLRNQLLFCLMVTILVLIVAKLTGVW